MGGEQFWCMQHTPSHSHPITSLMRIVQLVVPPMPLTLHMPNHANHVSQDTLLSYHTCHSYQTCYICHTCHTLHTTWHTHLHTHTHTHYTTHSSRATYTTHVTYTAQTHHPPTHAIHTHIAHIPLTRDTSLTTHSHELNVWPVRM